MEKIYSTITKLILLLPICLFPLITQAQQADGGITLYTPYTSRSVTPGQSLNYNVEVINGTNSIQNVNFSVYSLPDSWEPTFTASANTIQQIAVKPKMEESGHATKNINLDLNVPLRIKKGLYRFTLHAETGSGLEYELPLQVQVTEQGTFETELQVDLTNMEGYADSDFTYNFTLNNQIAEEQNYALTSDAPPGWDVRFRAGGNYVTSVTLASNKSKDMRVKVTPSQKATADTSKIMVEARSGTTSDQATLETVIKGKYNLKLTTPSGRLSTEVTAGSEKTVPLSLQNTGTVSLRDISLNSNAPASWSVEFGKQEISKLDPGESTTVNATIKASSKAIAGDYQLQIDADTPEASSKASFRVTVNKSITWGSIGIVIILLVVGGISYLFKTYGRR